MSDKKLFLLDGMALIYRSYFAFSQNHRYNSKGLNTSTMFGFTLTLLDLLQKEKPSHIAVVFDTSEPTERHVIFPEYKAHREAMPEDLSKSIPYIFKIIEAFNIPVITKPGYEADDIIGTLAHKGIDAGYTTYMMTPDKDFAQLVTPSVLIYKPAKNGNAPEIMDVEAVKQKWEIEHPMQVIDILALWGDAVDNIPGIPGFGEKTAKKLIAQFGSVENMIANVHQLKGSQKEKVETFAEQALLSKKLATILLDVPIEFDEKSLTVDPPNLKEIAEIFAELEFKTLMGKINQIYGQSVVKAPVASQQHDLFSQNFQSQTQHANNEEIVSSQEEIVYKTIENSNAAYILIHNLEELSKLVEEINNTDSFCFDTETDGLDTLMCNILGISISTKAKQGAYIPLNHESKKEYLALLKPVFESNKLKIAQNLKFDFAVLRKEGITIQTPIFDTMLAHYLIEPDRRHKMDDLARQYLQYSPVSIEELIGKKGKNQGNMNDVPLDILAKYAAEDADITLQLKNAFAPKLKELELETLFNEIEMPLIPVLDSMESEGVRIDTEFLSDYSKELETDIRLLEKEIYEIAGVQFNIASPKQLGEVLFDKLKLDDKAKKTKTGQYQTNEEVLQKLESKHDIIKNILDFRELQKLKSTYVDALPLLINENSKKIHTSYNQAVAATGRLSSNNPNLQNIPIRTEKGRRIRKAFVPSDSEHSLLSIDYSQIELRVIASMSKDENMISAFNQNLDIHTATAAKVFGVAYEEVDKEMRRRAKTVNFGIIYGISAFGLSERIGISRTEAKAIIDNYFLQFPAIKKYMDDTIAFAKEHGYVKTLLGRRRYVPDIHSNNATVRGFAERNAINAPIQGTAADMIKIAMIEIHSALKEANLKSKMILQVHDELVFDVLHSEMDKVKSIALEKMQKAMKLEVPLVAEYGVGENWLEAH